jgi:serine protease
MLTAAHLRLGLAAAALAAAIAPAHAHAAPAPYVPSEVIVRYRAHTPASVRADTQKAVRVAAVTSTGGSSRVLHVARGQTVQSTIRALLRRRDVVSATPNYVASTDSAGFTPNDTGRGSKRGWIPLQWNFIGHYGVGAPTAWTRLRAAHRPGARGVRIAVIDTGVAYRNWRGYRRSPDFGHTRFSAPYDFIAGNRLPLDRNGHGTHVTGTIAEETDNGYALTGLAYGATIIPIRVFDAKGHGNAAGIARGVRYAVHARAAIINLSVEIPGVSAADIPDLVSAIRYARSKGVLVIAAAGNGYGGPVAYPARTSAAMAVGASTSHGCLADYSNDGTRLDIVAPGGGDDADLPGDRRCDPFSFGRPIYQLTFPVGPCDSPPHSVRRFVIQACWAGTSMSTPHVTGVAALVIASGVLGPHPTPDQLQHRLMSTARDLGAPGPDTHYGAGLVDATRATAPAGR